MLLSIQVVFYCNPATLRQPFLKIREDGLWNSILWRCTGVRSAVIIDRWAHLYSETHHNKNTLVCPGCANCTMSFENVTTQKLINIAINEIHDTLKVALRPNKINKNKAPFLRISQPKLVIRLNRSSPLKSHVKSFIFSSKYEKRRFTFLNVIIMYNYVYIHFINKISCRK